MSRSRRRSSRKWKYGQTPDSAPRRHRHTNGGHRDKMLSMNVRALLPLLCVPVMAFGAEPELAIKNGPLQAKIYLPEVKTGFYQGTRFDWSGVIHSLTYKG